MIYGHFRFPLIQPLKEGIYDPIHDLCRTVALMSTDFPDIFGNPNDALSHSLVRNIERVARKRKFDKLKTIHQSSQ